MTKIVFLIIALATITSCQSTSDITASLNSKDAKCGRDCTAYYNICNNETSATPIGHHNACVEKYRYCVNNCPSPSTNNNNSTNTIAQKLEELKELRDKKLISEKEYLSKRQEILHSM